MPDANDSSVVDSTAITDREDIASRVSAITELQAAQRKTSIGHGVTKNPDQQAHVEGLSSKTGLAPDIVESQQAEVERRVKALELQDPNIGRRAPTVNSRMSDPRFVGLSHDDMENLVRTEELIRRKGMGYFEKMGATFKKNVAMVNASEIGVARWQAQLGLGDEVTEEQLSNLRGLQADMSFDKGDMSYLAGLPIESVGMLPMVYDVLAEGGIAASAGAIGGGLIGGAITRTPAGAAVGAKIGGGVGFKLGVFNSVFNIESGLAYNDYAAVEGVDKDMAAKAAITVGVINGSLEFASLSLIGRTATPVMRSMIRSRVRRMMATESGRQLIARVSGTFLAAQLGEGLTEAMQEITTMGAGEFSRMFQEGDTKTDQDFHAAMGVVLDKLPEIVQSEQVEQSFIVGTQAGGGLAVPGSVAQVISGLNSKRSKTQNEQKEIDEIVELSTDAKLRPRSEQTYRQTIQEVAEEIEATTGEVNEVYWTAREAAAWLEAEEIDINEPPKNVSVAAVIDQLSEALQSDGDIVLPIADFATDIAPTDSFAETVRAHVKLSDDAFTLDELSNIDSTIETRIKRLVQDAKISVEEQVAAEEIAVKVQDQLVDTKQLTPDAAKTSAALISNYVLTKAARTGLSVEEVYGTMGLDIVGPDAVLEGDVLDQKDKLTQLVENISEKQDFGDLELEEDIEIAESGEIVPTTQSAQVRFDSAVKRKNTMRKLLDCVNGS